jgi:hypothetical protein
MNWEMTSFNPEIAVMNREMSCINPEIDLLNQGNEFLRLDIGVYSRSVL